MSIIDKLKGDKQMATTTNKTNELTVTGANALVTNIKEGLALVSKGYLMIAPDVAKLYDCKGYKALGYKNFDEMCTLEFGMSHGTTVGIRKVFDRFGTVSKENVYSIPDKYLEFGYTKLLLMTDKKFEEVGINPTETFTPDMTINEMKDALQLKLEEKAEKQEKEAIDTTATEEVTEEKSIIDNSEEVTEENLPKAVKSATDIISEMLDNSKMLRELLKDKIKPEKMALLDAIEANLKDLKKVAK